MFPFHNYKSERGLPSLGHQVSSECDESDVNDSDPTTEIVVILRETGELMESSPTSASPSCSIGLKQRRKQEGIYSLEYSSW